MPSPLNLVPVKIAFVSNASSTLISCLSSPRFLRIWRAESYNFLPFSLSVFIWLRLRTLSPLSMRSLSLMTEVSHCAAWTTSFTIIFPSCSVSMRSSVCLSNSSPSTGQLSTVQSFWSSSPRCAMSSPDAIFTRIAPPREQYCQSYDAIVM